MGFDTFLPNREARVVLVLRCQNDSGQALLVQQTIPPDSAGGDALRRRDAR